MFKKFFISLINIYRPKIHKNFNKNTISFQKHYNYKRCKILNAILNENITNFSYYVEISKFTRSKEN